MIVGIVLIHSGVDIDGISSYPLYEYVVTRGIIGTFTRVCVPLFFLISGYLFFCNIKQFDRQAYVAKLKKRGRSLLEPYLFYNTLAICILGRKLSKNPSVQPNSFLLASTFFIFAMHSPYNGKIVAIMLRVLPVASSNHLLADLQCILYYFLTASLWIMILLAVFALIRKVSPKLAIFLSGGR